MVIYLRFFNLFFNTYKKLMKKSYSTLSGAIAFFLIINGGSVAYLILFISNLLNFDIQIENKTIMQFLNNIKQNMSTSNNFFTIFFIITSIYGASSLFFHLLKTGEMIYEETNSKFTIIKRFTAIIFLFATIFIVELFFILLFLGENLFSTIFWSVLRFIIFLFVPYILSVCINFFITPHKVRFKEIKRGAFITTIFWYVITISFAIYINIFSNYKMIYGALTFFVVFMIWLYLLSQGLVIGIIFNYYEKEKNTRLSLDDTVNTNCGTPKEDNEKT